MVIDEAAAGIDKLGFRTVYAYHYRARPDECHST
jgi:hypothetical protein